MPLEPHGFATPVGNGHAILLEAVAVEVAVVEVVNVVEAVEAVEAVVDVVVVDAVVEVTVATDVVVTPVAILHVAPVYAGVHPLISRNFK